MTRNPSFRPPSFMSRKELAWELSVSESTVDELVRRGVIPPSSQFTSSPDPLWHWYGVERRLNQMPKCGTIYVVGFGDYRKIGYTDHWPAYRYAAIQTGSPEKLVVFGESFGTRQDEADLHRRFGGLRTYGEWFRCEGELAAWIAAGCVCVDMNA
jgi:hypothetical protein